MVILIPFFYGLSSASPKNASAESVGASMDLSPDQESHYVGRIFSVSIRLTSLRQPVNAVRGNLKFSKDNIELINNSKTGSVVSVWIEDVVFSNSTGTINFTGGIPSPGYVGAGGRILTLTFKAIAEGPATIAWEEAEILANDGKGTNILTSTENANYLITAPIFTDPSGSDSKKTGLSSIVYILMAVIAGSIIIVSHVVRQTLLNKRSLREDLRHFEKDLERNLKNIEEDVAIMPNLNKEELNKDITKFRENLEEEIKEVARKLD